VDVSRVVRGLVNRGLGWEKSGKEKKRERALWRKERNGVVVE